MTGPTGRPAIGVETVTAKLDPDRNGEVVDWEVGWTTGWRPTTGKTGWRGREVLDCEALGA